MRPRKDVAYSQRIQARMCNYGLLNRDSVRARVSQQPQKDMAKRWCVKDSETGWEAEESRSHHRLKGYYCRTKTGRQRCSFDSIVEAENSINYL